VQADVKAGRQLVLFSTPCWRSLLVPWNGRSPRDLTRVATARRLAPEGLRRLDLAAGCSRNLEGDQLQLQLVPPSVPFAGGSHGT